MTLNNRLSLIPKLLIGLALAAFVGYFIVYTIYAIELFKFPFDYDQGEGFELMDTILFSQGEWPYKSNDTYPFYSSNYPPVYHLVIVPLVWLFGPHYWTGRVVGYIGTLITAGAIGYAVQREGKRWWLSSLAGLAFLASNYVYHVGPLFRQHMFMVMFETLAVVLIGVVLAKPPAGKPNAPFSTKGMLIVMLLLLLAGYTKQLAYASVIAIFIFFFVRHPKKAILWALPFAGVTGAIFFLINWGTDGQWLINTVTANINPFIPGQFSYLFRQWFRLHAVITVVAAGMAVYQLYFERLSIYTIWFVVAVANSLTAGKWGAGESYFATAIAASCILTGLAFAKTLDWSKKREGYIQFASLVAIPVLFLIQANLVFHMPTHTPTLKAIANALGKPTEVYLPPQTSCSAPRPEQPIPYVDSGGVGLLGRPPNAQDKAAGLEIVSHILAGKTAAFSEEAGFSLYAGRDVVTNPTQLLNLYNNNEVDLTDMLAMLEAQAFDTIILRAQFYPRPVLDALGANYQTQHLIEMNGFVYCIMEPRIE